MANGAPRASRPQMPLGYGLSQSADGMLAWSWVTTRLTDARNYWISTADQRGRPHAAPVWGIWSDTAFWFATDRASRKGRNLAQRLELVVHLESGDDVVILEGTAREAGDAHDLAQFVDAYDAKYQIRPQVDASASVVYTLAPRLVLAWREQDFPASATRWTLEQS